jgi:hypothetical protein
MKPRSNSQVPNHPVDPTFKLVDPFFGRKWSRELTPEEQGAHCGALRGNTETMEATDASAPKGRVLPLPSVVVEAQRFAAERHSEFEAWGVTKNDAKVLAFLWRLHDNLPSRGCVIAAQKVIAEWLGCVRQTVAKILERLVASGLLTWVSNGWYSYKEKLAREVRWVGLGEPEMLAVPAPRWSHWKLLNAIRAYIRGTPVCP